MKNRTAASAPNWASEPLIADDDPGPLGADLPLTASDRGRPAGVAAATASIVRLEEPGLYALDVAGVEGARGEICGMAVPAIHVAAPAGDGHATVEIVAASGSTGGWLGREGGTAVIKSSAGGSPVLITVYGLPRQRVVAPAIELRRLDRLRPGAAEPAVAAAAGREIETEIVLHMERLGDRRLPGRGWLGNPGQKLRIEAFSIRPLEALSPRDVEFKAWGPNGRQTPWVTSAKLCGTRGRGLPLTGFAIRIAEHLRDRFDIVYQGAFFDSGIVGPTRNGAPCTPRVVDDPLAAMNVRLIERAAG